MLCTAEDHDAQMVTNDHYKDYQDEFDIEERRVPCMLVGIEVELYWPEIK